MLSTKQHLLIKNKTNDFFIKNLLNKTPFLVICYKNNLTNGVKTITKNQICNSLSPIINKKTEKFPLSMNTFEDLNTLANYINLNTNFIISLIKVKRLLFKGKNKFKTINLSPTKNFSTLHSILIKKYFLFKIITTFYKDSI